MNRLMKHALCIVAVFQVALNASEIQKIPEKGQIIPGATHFILRKPKPTDVETVAEFRGYDHVEKKEKKIGFFSTTAPRKNAIQTLRTKLDKNAILPTITLAKIGYDAGKNCLLLMSDDKKVVSHICPYGGTKFLKERENQGHLILPSKLLQHLQKIVEVKYSAMGNLGAISSSNSKLRIGTLLEMQETIIYDADEEKKNKD